ncbi:MAG: alpha-glucan phosphorylase [Proteobacteria bacterium]|nr:alpha-glucan phosphorylase [Pseudomonadota bacterium]
MIEKLTEIARDFWWTGDPWANELWKDLSPQHWEASNHNPLMMLTELSTNKAPKNWKKRASALIDRYEAFKKTKPLSGVPSTAYFCMEFGMHESFPIYSGGLGILAGDHIRSAGDLGLPFTGIGLMYKHGYFSQLIVAGRQVAANPNFLEHQLPLTLLKDEEGAPIKITVPLGHSQVLAQAWSLKIGHAELLLLDTQLHENLPEHKALTENLYGMGHRLRISQEILLGIGGVRLLKALKRTPDVYHLNEGHAAFLILELWINQLKEGQTRDAAWKTVEQKCVFTTHTPVPAGHDRFYWHDVNALLGPYRDSLGLPPGAFMNAGRENIEDLDSPLSMTVLALNGSRKANGVSKLHGEVSRDMFSHLGFEIDHITNGVHPTAWLAPELADLFNKDLPGWENSFEKPAFWKKSDKLSTTKLWNIRKKLRARLIADIRRRLGEDVLDEKYLTIGFARRFATYKRGTLIFKDPDRLAKILSQGVQLIFAGKAHPADKPGQEVLATILRYSRDPRFYGKIVFVPNYDASIGRYLTQGCDVWLNNPRRPREASGTSGQKAALNGNPNLSILDGWWPEGYDATNGWAIGEEKQWESLEEQDLSDSESLYQLLEQEVIPTFKSSKKWTTLMKRNFITCLPKFNTHRMVRDYLEKIYTPE